MTMIRIIFDECDHSTEHSANSLKSNLSHCALEYSIKTLHKCETQCKSCTQKKLYAGGDEFLLRVFNALETSTNE